MKIAFVVYNEYYTARVMQLLRDTGIDYYTHWEHTKGKGHGTDRAVILGLCGEHPETVEISTIDSRLATFRELRTLRERIRK